MVPPPWALPPACRDRGAGSVDPSGYEVGRKQTCPMNKSPPWISREESLLTSTASYEARLARLLDRLELVLEQIGVLEEARDAVVAREAVPGGEAEGLVRRLVGLKGIGPELATLLAWEAFVRPFRDRRALAAYAGLT